MILFLCSIILFAFPMAELTYDNDKFISAGTIRDIPEIKDLELFSTDRIISPEIIYDVGEPVKRVKFADQLPNKGKFGLLAYESIPEEIERNFNMEFIVQFDINNLKEGKSGHKTRKTSKLFILEKK